MKTNYHTHTQRCLHAQGTEEDYIRAALEAGVSVLGFSDHAPFPDKDYGLRMPYEELDDYFFTLERLANTHASDIIIKKSLEIEYLPQYTSYYEALWETYSPDYLILGEHFFLDDSGRFYNITTQAEDTSVYLLYARAAAQAMKTGYFQMIAHPDIFAMSPFAWDRNCDAATDLILEAAAETGTILEFNANGLRRGIHDYPDGRRHMYPHPNFWKKVPGSGIPVIIGSDCHSPTQVWDECMHQSQAILQTLGICPITLLEDGSSQF